MIITSFSTIIFVPNVTKWHAIVALTMNISLGDFAYSGGFYPTLLNLAPNYAGLLSGISTFIAFVVACPATVVNSVILKQVSLLLLCARYLRSFLLSMNKHFAISTFPNRSEIDIATVD